LKKILLSLLLLILFASSGFANLWAIRTYLELMGQYSLIFNARQAMSVPAEGNVTHAAFLPSFDFNGVFMFGGDDGVYSLYVRKDYIELHNKNTVVFSAADNTSIFVDEPWGLHYVGIGGRKYFFIDDWHMNQIMPYAGIDLGGYFTSDTLTSVTFKDGSNNIAKGDMQATGGFFGVNVEAGADFWIVNEIAVLGKIGYRFCSGMLRSTRAADPPWPAGTLADVYDTRTDFSGFYIQLGVSINFQRYD
jgi:hypothetical protein